MRFALINKIYRHVDDEISLCDVWSIEKEELNTIAKITLKHLQEDKALSKLHRDVAWLSQALIEFSSILDFPMPHEVSWWHKNYLYFEATHALREATVEMLNGLLKSSMGTLRSALQMFLLHCWWQERMIRGEGVREFNEWFEGKRLPPTFKDMVRDNLKFLDIPSNDLVKKTYKQLCAHVHVPLIEESLTTLRQGNMQHVTVTALLYWFSLARDTLQIALEHFVHHRPQSLFPVDVPRKFGFNPPVGLYFNKIDFIPLNAVLGEERIKEYRERLGNREVIQDIMNSYESRPDFTPEQLIGTLDDSWRREFGNDIPDDLDGCWFLMKTKLHVMSMAMAYTSPDFDGLGDL